LAAERGVLNEPKKFRVYDNRQEAKPGCLALTPRIVNMGILPADCPYVQGIKDYRPPHLWEDDEEP
jgi:uncharacterized protein